jgi:hypothetical protein
MRTPTFECSNEAFCWGSLRSPQPIRLQKSHVKQATARDHPARIRTRALYRIAESCGHLPSVRVIPAPVIPARLWRGCEGMDAGLTTMHAGEHPG